MHRVGADPADLVLGRGRRRRRPGSALRRPLDPSGGGRRDRRRGPSAFTAGQLRLFDQARGHARPPPASIRPWSMRPTRPGPSPTPRPVSTWSAAVSPSTVSPRRPPSPRPGRRPRAWPDPAPAPGPLLALRRLLRPDTRRRRTPLLRPPPAPAGQRSVVATVPIGYADGVPRRYFTDGGTVLVGGRRRPLAGTVTMDQIVVDCGPDASVSVGDEVVLIGRAGDGVAHRSRTGPRSSAPSGTRCSRRSGHGCPGCVGRLRQRAVRVVRREASRR